jgi:hypothetical protein
MLASINCERLNMPKKSFADRIVAQIEPKNPSAEAVQAVLRVAESNVYSMGKLLDMPLSERRQTAEAAKPMFDAIKESSDPGRESFIQFAKQNDKLMQLDGSDLSQINKQNILVEIAAGIRSAIGPKSVEIGSPS